MPRGAEQRRGRLLAMMVAGLHADEAGRLVLAAQAAIVEEKLPLCLGNAGPDPLHDLRVAVRRSRSVLRQLSRAFPRKERRKHARTLSWIQDVTGPSRDLDVQLLDWEDLIAELPRSARAALEPAHDLLVARREDVFAVMHGKLGGPKFDRRWSAWRSFLAGEPDPGTEGRDAGRRIEDVVGERVHLLRRRLVEEGSEIDRSSPAAALHDLRKRGKELRYLLELFGDVWPAETIEPVVQTLKRLQDALGDHQDLEVQIATLRSLQDELRAGVSAGAGDEAGSRDTVRALAQLIDHLEREQSEARARFAEGFGAFAGTDLPVV